MCVGFFSALVMLEKPSCFHQLAGEADQMENGPTRSCFMKNTPLDLQSLNPTEVATTLNVQEEPVSHCDLHAQGTEITPGLFEAVIVDSSSRVGWPDGSPS